MDSDFAYLLCNCRQSTSFFFDWNPK